VWDYASSDIIIPAELDRKRVTQNYNENSSSIRQIIQEIDDMPSLIEQDAQRSYTNSIDCVLKMSPISGNGP